MRLQLNFRVFVFRPECHALSRVFEMQTYGYQSIEFGIGENCIFTMRSGQTHKSDVKFVHFQNGQNKSKKTTKSTHHSGCDCQLSFFVDTLSAQLALHLDSFCCCCSLLRSFNVIFTITIVIQWVNSNGRQSHGWERQNDNKKRRYKTTRGGGNKVINSLAQKFENQCVSKLLWLHTFAVSFIILINQFAGKWHV